MTHLLRTDDPGLVRRFRKLLDEAGYDEHGVSELLGTTMVDELDVPVHERQLPSDGRLPTLLRLFLLGLPVPTAAATEAFEPISVDDIASLGLVSVEGNRAEPRAVIALHGDVLLASDGHATSSAAPDHVTGVSLSSMTALALTVREPVTRALDIGTGSGVQALTAAVHAEEVVATDVNPRALAFTRFNALLNGREEIEVREGSFLEPVAGETFGLVTCNAPYVISPDTRYAFRDAGRRGDEVCEELLRGIPALLEPGGTATLVFSWIGGDTDDWAARPREWIDGSGCDAWLVAGETLSPLEHSAKWTGILHRDPEAFAAALERWIDYLAELGATAITEAGIVLRKREGGTPRFRADRLPANAPIGAADQLERAFAAWDFLDSLASDDELLDARLALPPTCGSTGRSCATSGEVEEHVRIALTEGLLFEGTIDPALADTLLRLDGKTPVRDAVGPDAPLERVAEVMREMLETGFLEVPPK